MSPRKRRVDSDVRFAIVPEWVFLHDDLKPADVRVYAFLSKKANDDGDYFCGRGDIAEAIHMSPGQVGRCVRNLRDHGALDVTDRRDENLVNLYHVHYSPPEKRAHTRVSDDDPARTGARWSGEPSRNGARSPARTDARSKKETSKNETSLDLDPSNARKARTDYEPAFDATWEHYPRKQNKRGAYRAWKARTRADVSATVLHDAVLHYAESCRRNGTETKFVMHGATFFGPTHRYEDYIDGPIIETTGTNGTGRKTSMDAARNLIAQEAT